MQWRWTIQKACMCKRRRQRSRLSRHIRGNGCMQFRSKCTYFVMVHANERITFLDTMHSHAAAGLCGDRGVIAVSHVEWELTKEWDNVKEVNLDLWAVKVQAGREAVVEARYACLVQCFPTHGRDPKVGDLIILLSRLFVNTSKRQTETFLVFTYIWPFAHICNFSSDTRRRRYRTEWALWGFSCIDDASSRLIVMENRTVSVYTRSCVWHTRQRGSGLWSNSPRRLGLLDFTNLNFFFKFGSPRKQAGNLWFRLWSATYSAVNFLFCEIQQVDLCPFYGEWSAWTACTVTCGRGSKSRNRTCINGSPGVIGCDGSSTQTLVCNEQVSVRLHL